MEQVRIVFFDAGGTLLRPKVEVGEAYAAAGRRYGVDVPPRTLEDAFRTTFLSRKLDGKPQNRDWWRDVVADTFGQFGRATDPEALFDDLYTYFTAPSSWRLYAGARGTVVGLQREGFRTGLISNWDDRLPELLTGLGLTSLLHPLVVSHRVGVEKPHARIFRTALREAGVEAPEALMVGDDYEADVVGATAVGMHAVFVRRDGRAAPDCPSVRHLRELVGLLPSRASTRE